MGAFTNGVYVPTIGEVGWGTNVNDFLTRSGQEYINVKQSPYGAVGDGSHDDTTAIQAAIDAAVGGAMSGTIPTPVRGGVSGTGSVYMPAGTYKITAPLVIRGIQGLRFWGAGSTATYIHVTGTMTQAIQLLGASILDMRGFTVDGVGGFAGSGHVTYGISWDWTPAQTSGSSYRSTFHDIWITNLDFKYGWGIGKDSAGFDVSGGEWTHCQVGGNFTPGDATTTQWQAAFYVGSGTAGNVLNHYFTDCSLGFAKYAYYIDNVANVSINHGSASDVETFVYKNGPGEVLLRDMRIEDSWRVAEAPGGAAWIAHLSVHGLNWSQALHSAADGRVIKWGAAGTVEVSNSSFNPDNFAPGTIHKVYVATTANRTIAVTLRNVTFFESATTGPTQHLEVPGVMQVYATFDGVTAIDSGGSWLTTYPPSIATYNLSLPAYTVTNPTTDRGLNVTGDTLPQVAEVLGTLIADLQSRGLIG